LYAPAKINLWLRVFPPDETGYHPLDTLFCAIDLSDEIEIKDAKPGINLEVRGADVGPHEKNLAYRAALEFFTATGISAALSIVLNKNIPAGAGLGGGSSDAAAVLMGLNEHYENPLPESDLMAMGARLGSDVPFFLCSSSFARATGHGEVLQGWNALPPAPLLLVLPHVSVKTADAYRWIDDAQAWSQPDQTTAPAHNWEAVAQQATNDFERVVFDKQPALRTMHQALAGSGARIALLSGSGSALFGLYDSAGARDQALADLRDKLPDARVIRAVTRT
jgi:4-diphosphocytidyl-2-C-methyl-D-erythritol kinase